jgi:hypothetical protein
MYDDDKETAKAIGAVVAIVLFIISTFVAWMELKYMTAGQTAQATVDRVVEYRVGRRMARRQTEWEVMYRYNDASGTRQSGSDGVPVGWRPPPGGTVTIEYVGESSRLAGHRNTAMLVVFFGSFAVLLVGGFLFWRHVREATRPSAPAPSAGRKPQLGPYGPVGGRKRY